MGLNKSTHLYPVSFFLTMTPILGLNTSTQLYTLKLNMSPLLCFLTMTPTCGYYITTIGLNLLWSKSLIRALLNIYCLPPNKGVYLLVSSSI